MAHTKECGIRLYDPHLWRDLYVVNFGEYRKLRIQNRNG